MPYQTFASKLRVRNRIRRLTGLALTTSLQALMLANIGIRDLLSYPEISSAPDPRPGLLESPEIPYPAYMNTSLWELIQLDLGLGLGL